MIDDESRTASIVEHLVELRRRLIYSLVVFFVTFLLCFLFKEYILDFLLFPYRLALHFLHLDADTLRLQSTQVLETFLVKIKISAFGGAVLAFPFFALQIYDFISPGLYKNEKKILFSFLFAAPFLFLIGIIFVFCIIAPLILWFSLSQQLLPNAHVQIAFIARISDYLNFIISLVLAFGMVFQLPIVVFLLARAGILQASMLVAARRWAIVVSFVFAAMVTPSDLFSMFGLALPTIILYEISIFLIRNVEKR